MVCFSTLNRQFTIMLQKHDFYLKVAQPSVERVDKHIVSLDPVATFRVQF